MIKNTTINRQGVEWIFQQPIDTQLEVLANHLAICKAVINSLLEGDVTKKAGPRYSRDKPNSGQYSRWGTNPGSVRIGNQKMPIDVPRLRNNTSKKVTNTALYNRLKDLPAQKEEMVMSVLKGLSMRDYSGVADRLIDSFGLSPASISRSFTERSEKAVEAFTDRTFEQQQWVGLFIDGKSLAGEQMIIALGVTAQGAKKPLAVTQSSTENSRAIKQMLADIVDRGFEFEDGLLAIIDGSKGIRKAVEETFGSCVSIQRCQWHKRENVVSYLPKEQQKSTRGTLQRAYSEPNYKVAKERLEAIAAKLAPINKAAYNSLMEGLEETLTIQRLGLHEEFARSFTTTNCIESINSQIEKYTRKVKHWMSSDQRYRWVVMGLGEAECNRRRVSGYKHLNKLKKTLKKETKKKKAKNHFLNGDSSTQKVSTKNET
jgi:transposase-like protein